MIKEPMKVHRKQWEFVFIIRALSALGMLAEGKKGLVWGVGKEPLVALFASRGAEIVATDMDPGGAAEKGWVETDQFTSQLKDLNNRGICEQAVFDRKVRVCAHTRAR